MKNLLARQQDFKNNLIKKFTTDNFEIIEFTGIKHPLTIKCNKCGNIKQYSRAENLYNNKYFCNCYSPKIKLRKEGEKLKEDYLNWYQTKGYLKYEEIEGFQSIGKNVVLKCKNCKAIQNRNPKFIVYHDDKCLCCEYHHGINKTQIRFQQQIEQLYGKEYQVISEYKDEHFPVTILHNVCKNSFQTKPVNFLSKKSTCPYCKMSIGEQLILNVLLKNKITFISQHRFDFIKKSPVDFYLPDYNIAIEFQGRQHFEPVEKFGGYEQLINQQKIDQNKKEQLEKHNIKVIYFTYKEIKNLESLVVQRLSSYGVDFNNRKAQNPIQQDYDIV